MCTVQCAGTSGELYDVHKDKEVCKLLPLKLAGSQQESFVQEEDFPCCQYCHSGRNFLKALDLILPKDQLGYTHIYCNDSK